jgi:hypothetical protein
MIERRIPRRCARRASLRHLRQSPSSTATVCDRANADSHSALLRPRGIVVDDHLRDADAPPRKFSAVNFTVGSDAVRLARLRSAKQAC